MPLKTFLPNYPLQNNLNGFCYVYGMEAYCGGLMGLSKKDLARKKANLKARLEDLQKKAKMDPLKRDKALHEEIAELQKKIAKK